MNNKNKKKMNIFYKLAFAAFCACVAALGLSLFVFLFHKSTKISLILGVSGMVLSLLGIIFCMVSKPKEDKEKTKLPDESEKIFEEAGNVPESGEAESLENIIDKKTDA